MRSVQPAPDLCLGPTSHFLLSDADVARLDRLLGRARNAPGEAPAEPDPPGRRSGHRRPAPGGGAAFDFI